MDEECSKHCNRLQLLVSIVLAEMDSALDRNSLETGHVHRWKRILEESLGEYTDSSWLQSIGFIEDATSETYRMKNRLFLSCEDGKWRAYLVTSNNRHYLCDVDLREDVTNLVTALKLRD